MPLVQHKFNNQVVLIKANEKVIVSLIGDDIDFNGYFNKVSYPGLTLPKFDVGHLGSFDENEFFKTMSRCNFAIKLVFLNSQATI